MRGPALFSQCGGSPKLLTLSLKTELLGTPVSAGSWERYRVIHILDRHVTLIFLHCSSGDEQQDCTMIQEFCIPAVDSSSTLQESSQEADPWTGGCLVNPSTQDTQRTTRGRRGAGVGRAGSGKAGRARCLTASGNVGPPVVLPGLLE